MRIFSPPDNLDEHILRSYSVLRWFMVGFGLALPVLLVVGGINSWWWLKDALPVQDSLSAYYHAGHSCIPLQGVYRDLFVGLLAAIGFCLIIYTGFGKLENWLLNIAGFSLLGVAYFPTDWPNPAALASCRLVPGFQPYHASRLLGLPVSVHVVSAIVFFAAITLVNGLTALDTVEIIADPGERQFWRNVFRVMRFIMPVSLGVVLLFLRGDQRLVLWLEWVGIWAFSFYWLLKSIEILGTKLDVDISNGNFEWVGAGWGRRLSRKTTNSQTKP
jgi:hypothetical protein